MKSAVLWFYLVKHEKGGIQDFLLLFQIDCGVAVTIPTTHTPRVVAAVPFLSIFFFVFLFFFYLGCFQLLQAREILYFYFISLDWWIILQYY